MHQIVISFNYQNENAGKKLVLVLVLVKLKQHCKQISSFLKFSQILNYYTVVLINVEEAVQSRKSKCSINSRNMVVAGQNIIGL